MFNLFWRPYVPGFRVRPQEDVPGFNIDENGLPRRSSAWSGGMLSDAVTQRYPDVSQTEMPNGMSDPALTSGGIVQSVPSIGLAGFRVSPQNYGSSFNDGPRDDEPDVDLDDDVEEQEPIWSSQTPPPDIEAPARPASSQFPEWVYRLATLLPQFLTPSSVPPTGGHVVVNSPVALPSTELPVAKRWLFTVAPQPVADMNARAHSPAAQSTYSPIVQRVTSTTRPRSENVGGDYGQFARLHNPWNTEIARPPIGLPPIVEARPVKGSNFILANAVGADERQTPLQQYQRKQAASSSGTVALVSDGPSLGQRLVQSSVDTIVPGAYYQKLARKQLGAGNYLGAGVYQGAALLDAALGAATFGLSTRLNAGVRAAAAEGAALFRRVFDSRSQLWRYLGRAPEGMQWHHIVEQSQARQFGQRAIQSVENIVAIPIEAHQSLNAYYSSKRPFSEPYTVREWLRGQSFEAQYKFGLERLKHVLGY